MNADGRFELLKGLDPAKDQSYFLHRLTQAQLSQTLFPVGELKKTEVRRIAAEIGLPNAKKKDSTGICFIGERPFRDFLNRYLSHAPGPMLDERGREVGRHVGLSFYTLGQRQGLGIGGVRERRRRTRTLVRGAQGPGAQRAARGAGPRAPLAAVARLDADDCSWVAGAAPPPGALAAKTRYRQADAACRFAPPRRLRAALRRRRNGPSHPGQTAVLYDGEVCLGGGVIDFAT